ncbi:MAG: DUF3105 domain-containing protein [Acidimicrobiales bacterium]
MVRPLAVVAVAVAIALALVGSGCSDDGGPGQEATGAEEQPTEPDPRTVSGGVDAGPADEGIDGVEAFRIDSNAHTEDDLAYDPAPPAGGEHNPVPGTCGFYEVDPPPDEMLVHDLEHGAIWVAYDPGLDDAQLTILRDLVAEQAKVMATPYRGLDIPLVVSAWGRQLRLDDAGDPRLLAFVEQYRNGANAPEPNAAC